MLREFDYETRILQDPASALIAATVLSTGTGLIAQRQQRKAQSQAQREAEEAEEEARLEAERMARETGPEQETATIQFGADRTPTGGGIQDFLIPRTAGTTSGLATGELTGGLGFS